MTITQNIILKQRNLKAPIMFNKYALECYFEYIKVKQHLK